MEVTLALAQYPITKFPTWGAWETHVERWIKEATEKGAEIAVFPEYGSMELASLQAPAVCNDLHASIQQMQPFLERFKKHFAALSIKYQLAVVAPSFPVEVEGRFVNRAFVFAPSGTESHQDKLFMTRFEKEEWNIECGEPVLRIFRTPRVKFGVQICYDGEFVFGTQALGQNGAQLIVMPSCTETIRGATRVHIGARARAMEQQCYVGVSQTIGKSTWSPAVDINYGYAAIYSSPDIGLPEEGIVSLKEAEKPGWLVQRLDLGLNEHVRREGQVLNFQDHGLLDVRWQGKVIRVEEIAL